MKFKSCFLASLLISSMVLASEIAPPPPPPPPPPPKPTPTASQSSIDESKKIINEANDEHITQKKSLIPDFPGQPGKSGGLIEFETPIQSNNSKSCS